MSSPHRRLAHFNDENGEFDDIRYANRVPKDQLDFVVSLRMIVVWPKEQCFLGLVLFDGTEASLRPSICTH